MRANHACSNGLLAARAKNGKPIEAAKTYKVAGWAPVAEGAKGEPIWDVVETYLRDRKVIAPRRLNRAGG